MKKSLMLKNKKITASLEDYLEAIYNITRKKKVVKAIEIANALDVKKSSVTEALQNLSKRELIYYAPYEPISLTSKGEALAIEVVKKHESLRVFIEDILGLENKEARENACRMEHVISEKLYDKMVEFTEIIKNYSSSNSEFSSILQKFHNK